MKETLLSREEFKQQVFDRDNHTCVFCDKPAVDAHHILDRKLWSDGGYYLSNGSAVCEEHHWECEKTTISVEEVRKACGIKEFVLPVGFCYNKSYDKWGNENISEHQRKKGILFNDDGVQKILKRSGLIYLFY
tara:strand:- start:21334 stop:21732 length:399 start_codon:yes stop_codon:yes gene_type:complete